MLEAELRDEFGLPSFRERQLYILDDVVGMFPVPEWRDGSTRGSKHHGDFEVEAISYPAYARDVVFQRSLLKFAPIAVADILWYQNERLWKESN